MALTDLQVLWIEGNIFKNLDGGNQKKAMLRLFIIQPGALSLSAFQGQGNNFETTPTFSFKILKDSTEKWNVREYLGNQKIGGNRIKRVKDAISSSNPDVILDPKLDPEFSNQIVYKIYVGKASEFNKSDEDFAEKFMSFGDTNPSPPRNSDDNDA